MAMDEASLLMRFRARHFSELFDFGGASADLQALNRTISLTPILPLTLAPHPHPTPLSLSLTLPPPTLQASRVGVLASFRHNDESECIRSPSSALQARALTLT